MIRVQTEIDGGVPENRVEAELSISGMTCAACVARVERALTHVDGVLEATVNLATERAGVVYRPELIDLLTLKQAVSEAGYQFLI